MGDEVDPPSVGPAAGAEAGCTVVEAPSEEALQSCPSEGVGETESAAALKALGNAAWQRKELEVAVDFWNRALRQHVEALSRPESGLSPLSEECRALEVLLYLNLAQGYLKLGEPCRALRACQVVLHEQKHHPKALYRAAEATLALDKFEEAEGLVRTLLDVDKENAEAKRLIRQVRTAKQASHRAEMEAQKAVAQRMVQGAEGFSDNRPQLPSGARESMERFADPIAMTRSLDIADVCATAARGREERLAAGPPLPEPTVYDLDAFRAKVAAKTKKMTAFVDKTKRKHELAQRSVQLAWLRDADRPADQNFDAVVAPFHDELRSIEAAAAATAAAAAVENDDDPDQVGVLLDENSPDADGEMGVVDTAVMDEMD